MHTLVILRHKTSRDGRKVRSETPADIPSAPGVHVLHGKTWQDTGESPQPLGRKSGNASSTICDPSGKA